MLEVSAGGVGRSTRLLKWCWLLLEIYIDNISRRRGRLMNNGMNDQIGQKMDDTIDG